MRRRASLLGAASMVAALGVACSGDDQRRAAIPEKPVPSAQSSGLVGLPLSDDGLVRRGGVCQQDEDCRSGLCDDGQCTDFSYYGFGWECDPNWLRPPRPPRPHNEGEIRMPEGPDDPCHGFLCIDRRCRSCTSDDECRHERGRRAAMSWGPPYKGEVCHNFDPGYRCYFSDIPILPETKLKVTRVTPRPPVVAPEGGFPHRSVPWGGACVRDGDCQSLFCDRGVCEELYGRGNFGHSCNPAEYQGTLEEIRKRASAEDGCGGYVCRDQRCRPCQSDADCPHGLPPFKCVTQELHRGKVCAGLARPISPRNHIPSPHRAPAPTASPSAPAAPSPSPPASSAPGQ